MNRSIAVYRLDRLSLMLPIIAVGIVCLERRSMAESSRTVATAAEPAAPAIHPSVPYQAMPLPLSDVRLTGGPLKRAQDVDAEYLLKLEPDRMLYYLRKRCGLEPKAESGYGGWDGDGRQLTGHIAGHYLSAISYMYAATGDPQFKQRVDYMVSELQEIQNKNGDGYIGALMGGNARGARRRSRLDRRQDIIPGTRSGHDSLWWIRFEWNVVAVVRRTQTVCGSAGRLSPRRKRHRARGGEELRWLGGADP